MENRSFFGCYIRQRIHRDTVHFFSFYARTQDVKKWSGIKRAQDSPEGTQRILKETRKKAITRFLRSNPVNTVPNNVVIAFEPGNAHFTSVRDKLNECFPDQHNQDIYNNCGELMDWGFLEFQFDPDEPEHSRPALVVDGQHRLHGISDFEQESVPILVVALVDASLQEQAFQFIVINNKAVRVKTEGVKSIVANLDEHELVRRLLDAGIRYGKQSPILRDINNMEWSPFRNLLDWSYNREGNKVVKITAIEQGLRILKNQFTVLDEDDSSLVEIFCAVWRSIRDFYPVIWETNPKFMAKVNLDALNEFIFDRLKFLWELNNVDIYNLDEVENQVSRLIQPLNQQFWELDWSINIQDSAGIRKIIKGDFTQMANNFRLNKIWVEDLKVPVVSDISIIQNSDDGILEI